MNDDDEGVRRPPLGLLFTLIGLSMLVGMIGGAVAGGLVAALVPRDEKEAPVTAAKAGSSGPSTTVQVTEQSAITDAVQKAIPGIVTILVQAESRDASGRVVRETNLGSGVVVDQRGYILTNGHVVDNAVKISVKLQNGDERPAVLVGDDKPFTDIAVIRVQPDGLTVVPIADSDALKLGQTVIAIGSPAFGSGLGDTRNDFNNTVTRGIVSGLHRRWPRDDTVMEDLIQTDAAINHGNSGGGLLTLTGELVGITTTVVRGTQQGLEVQGVAFALSSKTFKPLFDEIIASGKVQRPYVGIEHRQITSENVRDSGATVPKGAFVVNVESGSPAAKSGLQRGDIITRLGGQDISEDNPYLYVLIKQKPNQSVPLTFIRNGKETTVDLTIGLR